MARKPVADKPSIYMERQRGGNCRIHAVNALLGGCVLTSEEFKMYADAFGRRYHLTHCYRDDHVSLDSCMSIMDAIEAKSKYICLVVPLGRLSIFLNAMEIVQPHELCEPGFLSFLEFNSRHVWAWKKDPSSKAWFKLDSLRGQPVESPLPGRSRNGYIFAFTPDYLQTLVLPHLRRQLYRRMKEYGVDLFKASDVQLYLNSCMRRDTAPSTLIHLLLTYTRLCIKCSNTSELVLQAFSTLVSALSQSFSIWKDHCPLLMTLVFKVNRDASTLESHKYFGFDVDTL